MPTAARSPAPMASTTEDGPVAASPPAKTHVDRGLAGVGVGGDVAPAVELDRRAVDDAAAASSDWPMAAITVSASTTKSGLWPATGRRRPLLS